MDASTTNDNGLCPDWIYSDSSNVHIAKDKVWFTSYRAFPSQLESGYIFGDIHPVIGIGTVKLTVKAQPGTFTVYGTSTVELHNVLYVPDNFCNVIGRPLASVYQIDLGGSVREGGPPSRGGLSLHGRQIAHFESGPISFFSLAVLPPVGTEYGPSPFQNGASYEGSCHWPNEERARWEAFRDQVLLEHAPPLLKPPYTFLELEYVNKRWGSEFRFLTQHRLKMHEEKDRSEGRSIIRALMRGKDPVDRQVFEVAVEGKLGEYLLF